MLIKKIELQNFGAHKNLKFDTKGEKVIGLLGANGSGKSTLFSAIKFAFTGDITGTIESNLSYGEKKGFVEISFVKNGKEGTIQRTLGKSSKAKLTWGDAEKTNKKEIENALYDIIGGDKQALANAAFISQGSLNQLLFGSDTEREQLFIRLNNLSYLQKVSDAADQRIKVLEGGIENVFPALDSVNEQRVEIIERVEDYKKSLEEVEDFSSVIKLIKDAEKISLIQSGKVDAIENAEREIKQLTKAKEELLNGKTLGEIVTECDDKVSLLQEKHEVKDKLKNLLSEFKSLVMYRDQVEAQKIVIESTKKELSKISLGLDLTDIEVCEKVISDRIEELRKQHQKSGFMISNYKSWIRFQMAELSRCNNEEENLDVEDYLKDSQDYDSCFCPSCGSELQSGSNSRIAELQKALEAEEVALKQADEKLELPRRQVELLRDWKAANSLLGNYEAKCKEIEENMDPVYKEVRMISVKEVELAIDDNAKEINDLDAFVDNVRRIETNIKSKVSAIEVMQKTIDNNKDEIFMCQKSLDSDKFKLLETYTDPVDVYEEKQLIHNEIVSKISENDMLLNNLNKEYKKLLDKEASEKDKQKLVNQLDDIKKAFTKKGIPKEYLNAKFNVITELTQKNLDILGTDFFIEPSKDKSLAFNFVRFINGEQVKLPMDKLSGGQKVRLSLAFVLSVQQMVMSEVGFITLDEPSTHLDEEGIDSLGDLLKKIRDVFADSEHQLWVCDHNPKLEASFDKTLVLK